MAGTEKLRLEHEVLRDAGGEGATERDLPQVWAVPQDRPMQVTTSGGFQQGDGSRVGSWWGWGVQASVSLGGAPWRQIDLKGQASKGREVWSGQRKQAGPRAEDTNPNPRQALAKVRPCVQSKLSQFLAVCV